MKSLEDGSWPNIYSMIKLLLTEKKRLKQIKYLMKYSTLTQYTQLSTVLLIVLSMSHSKLGQYNSHNLLELVATCSPNKLYSFKGCHTGHLKLVKLKSPQYQSKLELQKLTPRAPRLDWIQIVDIFFTREIHEGSSSFSQNIRRLADCLDIKNELQKI